MIRRVLVDILTRIRVGWGYGPWFAWDAARLQQKTRRTEL